MQYKMMLNIIIQHIPYDSCNKHKQKIWISLFLHNMIDRGRGAY